MWGAARHPKVSDVSVRGSSPTGFVTKQFLRIQPRTSLDPLALRICFEHFTTLPNRLDQENRAK